MRKLAMALSVLPILALGCGGDSGDDDDDVIDASPVDPCATASCDPIATCDGSSGVAVCTCPDGYQGDGSVCADIDECSEGTASCDAHAACTNTDGDYTCECDAGWQGDGFTCADVDECTLGLDTCDPAAICTNTDGAFTCACPAGYDGDGTLCTDLDECAAGTDACDVNAACTNIAGSYSCTCNVGWEGTGYVCTDADECAGGTDLCDVNALCANTEGSYTCTCMTGWQGDGFTCSDLDECAAGTDLCDAHALCANLDGGYTCACDAGWTGDGFTCADIDECASGTACPPGDTCVNTEGSFTCSSVTCGAAFVDVGGTCRKPDGHVVLIGHDYYERNADVDRLLGNAVFMAQSPTVRILAYQQYADTTAGGERDNANAAIAAVATTLGRSFTIDTLSDSAQLANVLSGHDVLLVYEQESSDAATLGTVGAAWGPRLRTFVEGGGIVIVCDHLWGSGGTWRILSDSGLLAVTASSALSLGASVDVVDAADPIAAGVTNPYLAANGSLTFTVNEGNTVTASGGAPVVVHKTVPVVGHTVYIGHDFYELQADANRVVGNSVLLANHPGTIRALALRQYADTTGELPNTISAVAGILGAHGRGWTVSYLDDYTQLGAVLLDYDVLLVPEQEMTDGATHAAIGASWAPVVQDYVRRGGVVVVCDHAWSSTTGTWNLVSSAGLIGIQSWVNNATGAAVTVADPTDPVAYLVSATYTALNGSDTVRNTTGNVVVRDASGNAMVIHQKGVPVGQAVFIGHDYFEREASADRILANAVLLGQTHGTVKVLGWTQYADTAGEVANANAAINQYATALGRTVTIDTLADYTQLEAQLGNHNVLLVYEQEMGGDMVAVASAWAPVLQAFVERGGVVVVTDFWSSAFQIFNSSGLMTIADPSGVYYESVSVVDFTDPLSRGAAATYAAPNGSIDVTVTGASVVVQSAAGKAVVAHATF